MLRFILVLGVLFGSSAAEQNEYLLYRSEDRGRSWSRSDSGLPGDARINSLAHNEHVIVAGTDAGMFISHDNGRRWKRLNPNETNAPRVIAVALVNDTFFAAANNALLVSTNGSTWAPNGSFRATAVRSLLSHGGILYVGTDTEGVYKTADFGRTWKQLADGMPMNSQVLALSAVEDHVFAGLYARGLYRLDEAEQWIRVGAAEEIKPLALASIGGTLIAGHNPGGIYASRDSGYTWERWNGDRTPEDAHPSQFNLAVGPSSVSLDAPVWDLAAGDRMVFAGIADGIFYSEDSGHTWTRATRGLTAVSPGVAFLVKSNVVMAATLTNHKSH